MRNTFLASFVGMLALLALASGCGPRWTVVKQADPNPMTASSKFMPEKVSLEGLRVGSKSEAQWVGTKEGETAEKWEGDKLAMNDEFQSGFESSRDGFGVPAGPEGTFKVRAHFTNYEPGFYVGVASGNAQIDATIDVVDPKGAVIDTFKVSAYAGGMSAGQRARSCAHQIGATAAKYVRKRVGL